MTLTEALESLHETTFLHDGNETWARDALLDSMDKAAHADPELHRWLEADEWTVTREADGVGVVHQGDAPGVPTYREATKEEREQAEQDIASGRHEASL